MTQPIASDKIPTPTPEKRRTASQRETPDHGQATPSADTRAKSMPEQPPDVGRAAHLYAKQRADAAAASSLANAADALALARHLRAAIQSAPAAALTAHGGMQQTAAEAALAASAN